MLAVERWRVGREASARARARWLRADLHDAEYGAYLRRLPAEPLAQGLAAAVKAADVAAVYQQRFDASYRGTETPFEFKRGRVQSAYHQFESALALTMEATARWLEVHPGATTRRIAQRCALERVLALDPKAVTAARRLMFMEAAIAVLENARRSLYRVGCDAGPELHDPFRPMAP